GNGNLLAFFDFPGYEHPEFHETLGGIQHLAISMAPDQFAALKERLAAAGVEYRGPDLGVQNSVYVRDPDGLQVELCTAPLMNTEFDCPGSAAPPDHGAWSTRRGTIARLAPPG